MALSLTNTLENPVIFSFPASRWIPYKHALLTIGKVLFNERRLIFSCHLTRRFIPTLPLSKSQARFTLKDKKNITAKIAHHQISALLSLTWARPGSWRCLLPWEAWRAELCGGILGGDKERRCQELEVKGTRSFPNNTELKNCKKKQTAKC